MRGSPNWAQSGIRPPYAPPPTVRPRGLRLTHTGKRLPSLPHIQMTVEMLRARGVVVDQPDERTWVVAPGPISARERWRR